MTLHDAIHNLYSAFSRYKLSPHRVGCPHCVSDADHSLIHSLPLKSLGIQELARYSFKAMSTWGDVGDFKHFLPRIFQLISRDGGGSWIDPEVVFGKLQYGDWQEWPGREKEAIKWFLQAMWEDVLSSHPYPFEADSLLCCIALVEDDLAPYLDRWDNSRTVASLLHFADLLDFNDWSLAPSPKPGNKPHLTNSWWRDRNLQHKQVLTWLRRSSHQERLERAFFAIDRKEQSAAILSDAVTRLQIIQSVLKIHEDKQVGKNDSQSTDHRINGPTPACIPPAPDVSLTTGIAAALLAALDRWPAWACCLGLGDW